MTYMNISVATMTEKKSRALGGRGRGILRERFLQKIGKLLRATIGSNVLKSMWEV